jgi:cyclase
MQKITANVYVETGFRGCNTSFVVTGEGVVMIDTPMVPADAKKWAAEIAKYGPVRYVINDLNAFKQMLQGMAPGSAPLEKDFKFRAPEITLSERLTLYLGKHSFHLIAMPGHSPYQVTVYVPEERVVFTSDNVVTGIPFFRQAVPDEWIKSLQRLQQLDVDKVVTGHGEVQSKSYLPQMIKNIQTWLGAVAGAIEKGMTLAEAQEKVTMAKEFPNLPRDERTAGLIGMNVARLYEYLKK